MKTDHVNNRIVLRFDNLCVWIPKKKSWWRRGTKERNYILHNITGRIKEGEFLAILGPSGSGKTTFLTSLAGKCRLPSSGEVKVRGADVKHLCGGVLEIVPQFEVFMESLSVMEHLVFMTEMKLGSCKSGRNKEILKSVIADTRLRPHIDKPIRVLSGGERRLLSLATSFIISPEIVMCDEPTTGLDSHNAMQVVHVLKSLSETGKIVICTIHQPSSHLFSEFNSILLMAEGKLVYHGTQDKCRLLFESVNLKCPINYNPADFYLRAISTADYKEDKLGIISKSYTKTLLNLGDDVNYVSSPVIQHIVQRNWFKQIQLLIWRSSLTLKRDILRHALQLFLCITLSSIVVSACYGGVAGLQGHGQKGVQDTRGFLWLLSSDISYSLAYNAVYMFAGRVGLFRREVGVYSVSAYFAATLVAFIPRCVIWTAAYVAVATLTVELPNQVLTAAKFTLVLTGASVAAAAFGLGMGAMFVSSGISGELMPLVDLPLYVTAGVFLSLRSIASWLRPAQYISHFYYATDALNNIYWRQIEYIDCPVNYTSSCYVDGADVLKQAGYSEDYIVKDGLGFAIIILFWSILGYLGLKKEERKGYAY